MRRCGIGLWLLLAACGPYSIIRSAESNPLSGQTQVILRPLAFDDLQIDGAPAAAWLADQGDDKKKRWADELHGAAEAFAAAAAHEASGFAFVVPENPSDATIAVSPRVTALETYAVLLGDRGLVRVTVNAQLLDAQGKVVEEIATSVKVRQWMQMSGFSVQLSEAADSAAQVVAQWVAQHHKPRSAN